MFASRTTQGHPIAMTSGVVDCPAFTTSAGAAYKGGGDCFTLVQRMVV